MLSEAQIDFFCKAQERACDLHRIGRGRVKAA
jgi:hypothetical protein